MIIKCAICGNDLEVDNNTVDGQHFLCPYCGEKFEYRIDMAALDPAVAALPIMTMCDIDNPLWGAAV